MERTGSDAQGSWGRPDYRLRLDGIDIMPIEAKKPSVPISTDASSARQARSYGWSLSLPAALLTNFNEFIVFDARVEPRESDNADVAVIPGGKFGFEEYVTRFDDLWRLASYESLATEGLEIVYGFTRPPRGDSPFDVRFLGEFRKWRQTLAQSVAEGNPALEAPEVGRRTQSVLNALLFLRVCESRAWWEGLSSSVETSVCRGWHHDQVTAHRDLATGRVLVVWGPRTASGDDDALLRQAVGELLGVDPSAVRTGRLCARCGSTDHGRPVMVRSDGGRGSGSRQNPPHGLSEPPEQHPRPVPVPVPVPVHLSLSRAGDRTLVAVSTAGPVGVDVERADAAAFDAFARVALHPQERADVAAARTRTWVRKESLVKATGDGLAVDLRGIRLSAPDEPPALLAWTSPGAPSRPVQMLDLTAPDGEPYVASLTVLGRECAEVTVCVLPGDPSVSP